MQHIDIIQQGLKFSGEQKNMLKRLQRSIVPKEKWGKQGWPIIYRENLKYACKGAMDGTDSSSDKRRQENNRKTKLTGAYNTGLKSETNKLEDNIKPRNVRVKWLIL